MRYRIEVVGVDGEPTAPDDVAKKIVKQCRVLVSDYILITVQEWNRPSSGCNDPRFYQILGEIFFVFICLC
jgi:hypothetical protein